MHYWNFIGDVGVDIGMMLITDADNFSTINEKYEDDWDEGTIESEFSGYFVPWLGGDGDWNLFGIYVDKKTSGHQNLNVVDEYINTKYKSNKISLNLGKNNSFYDFILIYNQFESYEETFNVETDFIKDIEINSNKIAINDPCNAFFRDPKILENIIKVRENVKKISIYECSIGTLIKLNPYIGISDLDFHTLVSFSKNSYFELSNGISINKFLSLIRCRTEYHIDSNQWNKNLLIKNLNNGFENEINHYFERGYALTLVVDSKDILKSHGNISLSKEDFIDAIKIFCNDNDREFIFEEECTRYAFACTILPLASGFAAISETAKKLKDKKKN